MVRAEKGNAGGGEKKRSRPVDLSLIVKWKVGKIGQSQIEPLQGSLSFFLGLQPRIKNRQITVKNVKKVKVFRISGCFSPDREKEMIVAPLK